MIVMMLLRAEVDNKRTAVGHSVTDGGRTWPSNGIPVLGPGSGGEAL